MQQFFNSELTKDEIQIILIKKSHKAIFKIKSIDDITEHINLTSKICIFLKKEDTKWVEIPIDFIPKIPLNTISYNNKYNGNIVCHIEDFEKFYMANLNNFIKLNYIYVDPNRLSEDGWIKNIDPKKEKKLKYIKLRNDITNLVGDWNNM